MEFATAAARDEPTRVGGEHVGDGRAEAVGRAPGDRWSRGIDHRRVAARARRASRARRRTGATAARTRVVRRSPRRRAARWDGAGGSGCRRNRRGGSLRGALGARGGAGPVAGFGGGGAQTGRSIRAAPGGCCSTLADAPRCGLSCVGCTARASDPAVGGQRHGPARSARPRRRAATAAGGDGFSRGRAPQNRGCQRARGWR
jgi:hypothetical protein